MLYLFTFMYIFGFNIFSVLDSTILVGLYLTGYMLVINRNMLNVFFKIIKQRVTIRIIICFFLIIAYSLLVVGLYSTNDLTYIKTFVHLGIVIVIGVELYSFFAIKGKNDKIVNYVIIAFIFQSIFQWICVFFPEFSKLFDYFRSDVMLTKRIHYGGIRGIALSKSAFFTLSSSYALMIVMFFSSKNTLFQKRFKYLFFVILLTGTFFAGRTGYVGLLFISIMAFNKISKIKISGKVIRSIIAIISIIFLFYFFITHSTNNERLNKIFKFTFELFRNYQEGEGLRSTSTDGILRMYDSIEIDSSKTVMFGDGQYTDTSGDKVRYYKSVDIGYMRKILFFGVIGLGLSIVFQILLFRVKRINTEILAMILLLLTLEIKGEIIALNIMVNACITLYALCSSECIKIVDNYDFENDKK